MPRPFPEWARDEIARLRADADALEHTLKRYLADENEPAPTRANGDDSPRPTSLSPAKPYQPRVGPTKGDRIREFVKATGRTGVSVTDLNHFTASTMGMNINSTRSQLWYMKKDGEIEQRDDRLFWTKREEPRSEDPGLPLDH
jgi:hypothetical protein